MGFCFKKKCRDGSIVDLTTNYRYIFLHGFRAYLLILFARINGYRQYEYITHVRDGDLFPDYDSVQTDPNYHRLFTEVIGRPDNHDDFSYEDCRKYYYWLCSFEGVRDKTSVYDELFALMKDEILPGVRDGETLLLR